MDVKKQTKDYNCAVFSVQFLLGLYGIGSNIADLEIIMGASEEDGTSHEGIKKALLHHNLKWVSWYESHISSLQEFLPAIINYQYCDDDGCDGHYSVVLGQGHGFFIIYNPATGEIERLVCEGLEKNWYSERYGKGWFLQIINPELNVN